MASRARRCPERGTERSVLRVRSTQLCVPCENSMLECPQPLQSPSKSRVTGITNISSSSSRQMGWELPPLQYSMGMDHFIHWWWQWCLSWGNSSLMSVIPSVTPAKHGRHLLSAWQGKSSCHFHSNKNHLTGLPSDQTLHVHAWQEG